MSKSPDAFRTISEVARDLDLPQHVLRFWETRFSQIKPMKRGGGRRYYRPDDVDLLRGIRHLLYGEGYTIRGVQRILKEQGPRFVIGAGRGENQVESPSPEETEPQPMADAPPAGKRGGGNRRVEPSFAAQPPKARAPQRAPAPEEVRPKRSSEPEPGEIGPVGLRPADIERLEATLAELLECKRLLDQAK